ncbi:MAG: CBS domain-containing protein [Acidimicrobiia bacterium]|nr:CBS domain-containing protein [Acidimicrobiia bacterium]
MIIAWVLVVGALLVAAWVRAASASLLSIPRADALHDQREGRRGAGRVAGLLAHRDDIPAAVALTTLTLLVAAVSGATLLISDTFGLWTVPVVVIVAVLSAEVIARALGRRLVPHLAYWSAPVLGVVVAGGRWAAEQVPDENNRTEEEAPEDEIDDQERRLVDSVLAFSETVVREVMTPRPDMITVDLEATAAQVRRMATEYGMSRFPVVDEVGEVAGLVLVKDLLRSGDVRSIAALVREADFVPESKRARELLSEMQSAKKHMVIVVDEFGAVCGLVTIEDLLEELVGEIADETDSDIPLVEQVTDKRWAVDARLTISELAEATDIEVSDEEWDTVGGLVFDLAERVPEEGERFETEQLALTVVRMQGRRITEVLVDRIADRQ